MSRRTGLALGSLGLVLALGTGARDGVDRWIARTALPPLALPVSAVVTARDGTLLRAFTVEDGRWRLPLDVAEVDPGYLSALIAYEDKRFRSHAGVDSRALLRAGWQSVRAGRVVSGGSTLTMQVARLLERSGTGRWAGKLRQARVALKLERELTKDQILALYLRLAPMGGNVEGLRAGTLTWLGKEPARLTPAEAALMIALPQSPEARRPDRDPATARAARDRVLARLERAGLLDAGDVAAAQTDPLPRERRAFPALAPHLAAAEVAARPLAPRHALTVDARLQAALEPLAGEAATTADPAASAAIVVVDIRTGEILASVGGADPFSTTRGGYLDMTTAIRSPGSTLKPLIYAMAFDAGLAHPETLIADRPADFGGWAPQNFDKKFRGTVRVRAALQLSLNLPTVALLEALGPANLVARMRATGAAPVLGNDAPGLAIGLGGVGTSLRDVTMLYAALAAGGRAVAPRWRLDQPAGRPRRVIGAEAAWYIGDILAGLEPPPGAPRGRIAYKTGTSYGYRDAWAFGYDGAHAVGVWIGRPDGTPMPGQLGADLAAPLLFRVFGRIGPVPVPLAPPPPSALTVSNADLPPPLRRFLGPRDRQIITADGPKVAFPPDGATVEVGTGEAWLALKVRDGVPPFTWLADGRPVAIATWERETLLRPDGRGAISLSVIDAAGSSAQATVTLR